MDTLDEIISPKTARQVYGVVMDPETFEVDYDATNELRAKKKGKSSLLGIGKTVYSNFLQ